MTDILDEIRSVVVGDRVERFQGYDALARRAEGLIGRMQQIESALGANPRDAEEEWHDLATAAEALVAITAAQEAWLADYDAALARTVEQARGDLRSLNIQQGNVNAGDDS
ncbi:hypothetical protein [Sphingomonas sp. SORGH_AS_0879]|uniref:hypothetical protein n=1 Tax=Sphingomonas sp. SORGH_AS_0879 TaxID=3041790 RepID=UPI002789C304|nr:hypothetical protein [Sphingomonas sp. SORGH_AS_0879]MDQ1229691.1 hypothetical protein [Sphingomonas sp. SORGH_AS_0879]